MSLSQERPVKVTYSTDQDISDEILGGTICFFNQTGYKETIPMFTFFWTAFLYSVKNELEKYDLVKDVMSRYTRSLARVFPKLDENNELRREVNELCQHYWEGLVNDFTDLKSVEELSSLVQIAYHVNKEGEETATFPLKTSPIEPFLQISSNIGANISGILHQIENGVSLQYRTMFSRPQVAAQYQRQPIPPRVQMRPKNKGKEILKKILLVFLICVAAAVQFTIWGVFDDEPQKKKSISDIALDPVEEPKSGTILEGRKTTDGYKITVIANENESCVVKLKTEDDQTILAFYVRAGETKTMKVPKEKLYVSFAMGEVWYGEKHLFGNKTSVSIDAELRDFSESGWKYDLNQSEHGNLELKSIDKEDF